jgi:hypothetical protein
VIREELPGTAIIVLSAHVEVNEAMDLLARGGRLGYLLKSRVTGIAQQIFVTEGTVENTSAASPSWTCPKATPITAGSWRSLKFLEAR